MPLPFAIPCPFCGRRNGGPRPWDPRECVCPDCEDSDPDAGAALAGLDSHSPLRAS